MAQHFRLSGQDKERFGATRDVLRFQIGGRVPLQRTTATEEKAHGKSTETIFHTNLLDSLRG